MDLKQRKGDQHFANVMRDIRRANWQFKKHQMGAVDIPVKTEVQKEECLHVHTQMEEVLVREYGSYDNPQQEMTHAEVCTACGETV